MKRFILFVILFFSSCYFCFAYFSIYDITIFKDLKGNTYAQVTRKSFADYLKCKVGDIIVSSTQGLDDADVINKAIKSLEGYPVSSSESKSTANILIKRGVYNLGKKGMIIPWPATLLISGEGCDINLPGEWQKLNPNMAPGTFLVYSGSEKALNFIPPGCGNNMFKMNEITFVLLEKAEFGVDIVNYNIIRLDRVAVIVRKPTGCGIRVRSGGNACYFTNIIIKGPVEVGFDANIDWPAIINIHIDGFTKVGIIRTRYVGPIIGGFLRCVRK